MDDTILVLPSSLPALAVPSNQVVKYGMPVGFKVSAESMDPTVLSASSLPPNSSFDPVAGRFEWTPMSSQLGAYDITFSAKSAAGVSTKTVHVDVDSGVPAISNASQFACSPGAIATLTGKWLGPDSSAADPSGSSTELGGSKVWVNGASVPVLLADKSNLSFLCPDGRPGEALKVVLQTSSGDMASIESTMRYVSPTLLIAEEGNAVGLVFHAGAAQLATVRDVKGLGQPAQPGDTIAIRATGLGKGIPVFVKVGGAYVNVLSTAPTDQPGISQLLVRVPESSEVGDRVPVQIEVASPDGQTLRSNTVVIAIEPTRR